MADKTVRGNGLAMAIVAKVMERKTREQKEAAMQEMMKSKLVQSVPKKGK